jgi:hypothetical protein
MEKKVCTKCKEEKDVTEFNSGRNQCKLCRKEYREKNKEKIRQTKKEYREKNKEKIRQSKKEYYEKNKEILSIKNKVYRENDLVRIKLNKYKREWKRKRCENDLVYKLKVMVEKSFQKSFKKSGYTKNSRSYRILGCSYEEFKLYIESKFEYWMNWENYGLCNGEEKYGWDLDHIIPISSGKCEEDIIRLNHYSNIQPLCSYINRNVKRDKIVKPS